MSVKSPSSDPVEKTPYYRFNSQNMAGMSLAQGLPKGLKWMLLFSRSLPHTDPGNPAGKRM
jgi:hypothetical protein